ncbi:MULTISPECIES: lytic transglycosylase domain-containing protein [unclassified Aureimonas]|uniref:lytic transglycosylase domain-containing protein n=1 Tax=unclassified Aureimonas TaxID=2615206 RepID=UPI0007017BC3|nr:MULTISPECIES: lytic transglycosylase domain-containing protein [unclassified Aureimonas]KQT69931.1 lytic transglycosylase [Aureimonas sp. Leaf427]KQT75915.1 lytic transglycosylase [Aureimonas sp. Leaf460]
MTKGGAARGWKRFAAACLAASTLAAPAQGSGTGLPPVVLTALDPGTHNLSLVPPDLVRRAKTEAEKGAALVCDLIKANAAIADMSPDFFTRLIWKESRFDAGARSPVGAQGIAQFMPYTAKERGLADPFDPVEAIRHSALYLRDLKAELGNWGLAAAAYNGGINRVKRWRISGGTLPFETENYVLSITARPAAWFLEEGREIETRPLDKDKDFDEACRGLPTRRTKATITASLDSAPMKPWGVQVAGHPQQSAAMSMFRRVQGQYAGIIGDAKPIVMRARAGRLRIYAVRIGADSHNDAIRLCTRLRQSGASCVVFRN